MTFSLPAAACMIAALAMAGCGSHETLPADGASRDAHASHARRATVAAPGGGARDDRVRIGDTTPPEPVPEDMVWIPGGTFYMGCADCGMSDALPVHLVSVDGLWMDRTPVTNAAFERFVRATSYATVAERALDPSRYPGVPPNALVPGSAVFRATSAAVALDDPLQWWTYVPGASWRHPEGPGSSVRERADHPVVHIAFEDAAVYAAWIGKRLPTEVEFEFAARGGLDREPYAWGHELRPGGKAVANTWQGRFPARDDAADAYAGTSPVTAFPPNGYGLHDMGGNVWQWCADWYRPDTYAARAAASDIPRNPTGPERSFDPDERDVEKRVTRGGSFLCTDQYCARYLVGSRGKAEVSSGASNLGFRLVRSLARP
jgi:formylglycine-generating enzyme